VPPGTNPWALNYGGHQFGSWAQQLGDGRGICLGEIEVANKDGSTQRMELQLKGAGMTPHSCFADGFAVFRSSIREYLAAEAISLSLVYCRAELRGKKALNQELYSLLARATRNVKRTRRLHNRTAFPACLDRISENGKRGSRLKFNCSCYIPRTTCIQLIHSVDQERGGKDGRHDCALGFCHGFMNTDNFSILGLTIDYGPYQFLNAFEPGYICNHSDHTGRYAFNQQPRMAMWNLVTYVVGSP
ncbi:hypothetical protein BJ741DRAFT_700904, partial [Chytriomyces cf. hyalinus JEL632]